MITDDDVRKLIRDGVRDIQILKVIYESDNLGLKSAKDRFDSIKWNCPIDRLPFKKAAIILADQIVPILKMSSPPDKWLETIDEIGERFKVECFERLKLPKDLI